MKYIMVLLAFSNFAMAKVDTNLPEFISLENAQYSLCKEHTIRYAYVIKIAHVGLYLKDCSNEIQINIRHNSCVQLLSHPFWYISFKFSMPFYPEV